jgi:hypothetical protein
MRTSKHSKLKRHPIVRFIRGIFRLFRVLFRPKRGTSKLDLQHQEPIEASNLDRDRPVTVGELFGRVKWQSPRPSIQQEVDSNSRVSRPHDVSRN